MLGFEIQIYRYIENKSKFGFVKTGVKLPVSRVGINL
jgi:hypothetical protein